MIEIDVYFELLQQCNHLHIGEVVFFFKIHLILLLQKQIMHITHWRVLKDSITNWAFKKTTIINNKKWVGHNNATKGTNCKAIYVKQETISNLCHGIYNFLALFLCALCKDRQYSEMSLSKIKRWVDFWKSCLMQKLFCWHSNNIR